MNVLIKGGMNQFIKNKCTNNKRNTWIYKEWMHWWKKKWMNLYRKDVLMKWGTHELIKNECERRNDLINIE